MPPSPRGLGSSDGGDAFVDEELRALAVERLLRGEVAAPAPARRRRLLRQIGELGVGVAVAERLEVRARPSRIGVVSTNLPRSLPR